ncbi:MAG: Gfo/Idh/MocA family protein [Candidatus Neomarinimicrobiota bacterium]
MIKIGIIGFGKMGKIRYSIISSMPGMKVISYYDPEGKDLNINKVQSPNEILSDSNIDVVFICTPNYLNKSLTMASLKAGKHVFCEKPPAFTAKDVKEIRQIEKEAGKVLMYGFNHRHHQSIKHMKTIVDEKTFGKVLWMRGRYGKSVDETYYENWRSKREYAGGGILIDQGIHMVDLFLLLGGDFDNIHASVSNLYWKLDVEDNVFATLENSKTGLSATLHSTMTQWRHLFSLEVFLEKGYMVLNGLKTSSNTYGDEILTIAKNRSTAPAATWEDEEHITFDSDNSWKSEVDEFFLAISSGKKLLRGSSSNALRLMKVIDKIYDFRKNK